MTRFDRPVLQERHNGTARPGRAPRIASPLLPILRPGRLRAHCPAPAERCPQCRGPPGDERSAGQQPATGPRRPPLRPYRRRVESKPPKRRRPEWLPALHDPAPPRLWRIGYALAVSFAVAAAGLAALWQAALVLLNHPHLPHARLISLHDTVGVAQLVFASVAGAGALVALVVAYRRERLAETTADLDRNRWEGAAAHDRTRLLNERFTTIAGQLGDDQAAVRLAGVHAMAGLADDWQENRQTCADVLCAYLRMPYERTPDEDAPAAAQLAFQGNREVRHTVIRVITRHLRPEAAVSWQGLDFDFTGVVFDGGDFSGAQFSGGEVNFSRVADWSHPPEFSWGGSPPSGVRLPAHDGGEP